MRDDPALAESGAGFSPSGTMEALRRDRAAPGAAAGDRLLADRLNQTCACVTLDRGLLHAALDSASGDPAFVENLIESRPHLVSNAPVFIAEADVRTMLTVVRAIEAAARLPLYQEEALGRSNGALARLDFGTAGVFMGYDFHVTPTGPRIIEINTNAGGAFLNAFIGRAQRACCAAIEPALRRPALDAFEDDAFAMFMEEQRRQRGPGRPRRIAIVDDAPAEQYLYPEFVLAQRFFAARGIDAVIADARALSLEGGRLIADGDAIDLVYNRLVDFSLSRTEHAALRDAYREGAVVVTPGPRHHALLADKRNLALLSDRDFVSALGLGAEATDALAAIPRAATVEADNAEALWAARKRYFFKPDCGHGAKAVYRGDKLTKSVWADILKGGYIAQEIAPPGERRIDVDGAATPLKLDVRLYTYDGRLLLAAARLYQGQTTNFRTAGGGFAPVFVV